MEISLYQEVSYGVQLAFRSIVPKPEHRIPLTAQTAVYPLLCYVPFVFLAYLARRPDTYVIRLLLLPSVVTAILIAAYKFTWIIPELNVYNWGQCLFAAVAIAKALEFALTKEGMLKVGESKPGIMKGKGTANGHAVVPEHDAQSYIATWFYDAIELAHTMRGLHWKFGRGLHIPKPTRPLEREPFLWATLRSFSWNFLLLDLLESFVKLFPGVGTPLGGSIFYPELYLTTRYAVSTIIHIATGSALLAGFGMVYDLITLFAVGVLDSSPASWPPVMDNPWTADSMHAFWATHWHQLLRQTFLVFGGYPGQWIAGRTGMLLGAFLASGLFHELSMYSMNRGWDYAVIAFFAIQGPILVLEQIFRRVTGRRIGGFAGQIWVYFIMFILAQPMDSWHRRGLGGGMVIPPFISPFRIWVVPVIQRYMHK